MSGSSDQRNGGGVCALIVDDHPIARQGLVQILAGIGVTDVVEADGSSGALAAAAQAPELILLDLRIAGVPDTSVLCGQLRVVAPRSRIVIVTAFEEPHQIEQCLANGADGCLLKDTSVAELQASLRALLRGGKPIDPRVAQELALRHVQQLRSHEQTRLTARELAVLALLAEGCSNRAIAGRLLVAETTVKGYVSSVLEKLGAESRLQAVAMARERALL